VLKARIKSPKKIVEIQQKQSKEHPEGSSKKNSLQASQEQDLAINLQLKVRKQVQ